jgi:hypothetical protein
MAHTLVLCHAPEPPPDARFACRMTSNAACVVTTRSGWLAICAMPISASPVPGNINPGSVLRMLKWHKMVAKSCHFVPLFGTYGERLTQPQISVHPGLASANGAFGAPWHRNRIVPLFRPTLAPRNGTAVRGPSAGNTFRRVQITSARAKPSYPLLPTVWTAVALTRGSDASIW